MMAQKHLHQLLEEDQEPFHLNNYIAEKRFNLKRVSPKSHLQVKKRKPISEPSFFSGNFCKNACFSSFQPSPELRKSPLFEFHSPVRNSPCKSPNAIFLQIPARTAALLLEAALRIHKQKSSSRNETTQNRNQGFALFGSVLKRLTHRNRNTNRETETCGIGSDSSSCRRRKSFNGTQKNHIEMGFCNGRSSYGFWSESNEERSMDFGTSCSSQSEDSEVTSFAFLGEDFCESPFRFVLQRSPSYGCRTPDFLSPAASPNLCNKQDRTINSAESLEKFAVEEDEEDKEQCSPVSVLETPFDDDYNDGHGDGVGDGDYDLECSYATVQRARQELLNKLRRFERLADLDPVELEKVMLEEEQNEEDYDNLKNEESECYESVQLDNEHDIKWFVEEVMNDSSLSRTRQISEDMGKLVTDLIAEEEADRSHYDNEEKVVKRVCKRLELWEEVEYNTIDMMVEEDLRKEVDEWKKNEEQRGEAAIDVELAIFSKLVEELAMELACSNAKLNTRSFGKCQQVDLILL